MSKRKRNEVVSEDGAYVVKKNGKMNIVAFILCVLVAMIIWLYATNTEAKERDGEKADGVSSVAQTVTDSSCDTSL